MTTSMPGRADGLNRSEAFFGAGRGNPSKISDRSGALRPPVVAPPLLRMAIATVHVFARDVQLDGSYGSTSNVLYLSAPGDDEQAPAQETRQTADGSTSRSPEGATASIPSSAWRDRHDCA
jgi:hypothetical protein